VGALLLLALLLQREIEVKGKDMGKVVRR